MTTRLNPNRLPVCHATPGSRAPAAGRSDAHSGGPKLLDRVRMAAWAFHLAHSTERAYVSWIRRYILFHGKQHPLSLREPAVNEFLTSWPSITTWLLPRRIKRSRPFCFFTNQCFAHRSSGSTMSSEHVSRRGCLRC